MPDSRRAQRRAYLPAPPGASYPQLLRTPQASWWRSVQGVLLALWAWLVAGMLLSQGVLLAAWRLGHPELDRDAFLAAARRYEHWEGMVASHLSIITMIPVVAAVLMLVHRVPPGRVWSVSDRLRWRYFAACLAISVVVFGTYIATLPLRGQPLHWQPQPGLAPFVVVVLVLTPLQALAEEVLFRGYLLQAIGSLARNPWLGVVGSALLFAGFHGSQNPQLFLSRLAFGLVAGWLVLRVGGLEAGIAAHLVNNVFSFLLAGLTGSIAALRQVSEVGWLQAFSDVITFSVIAVLAALLARRLRVPDRAPD